MKQSSRLRLSATASLGFAFDGDSGHAHAEAGPRETTLGRELNLIGKITRGFAVCRQRVPTAAAHHSANGSLGVVAQLPHITVHVEQTKLIRSAGSDRGF